MGSLDHKNVAFSHNEKRNKKPNIQHTTYDATRKHLQLKHIKKWKQTRRRRLQHNNIPLTKRDCIQIY
jgi:hypothetical protein